MLPAVCKHMKKTFPFAAKEAVSMRLSWLMSQVTAFHLAKVPKCRRCEFELHPWWYHLSTRSRNSMPPYHQWNLELNTWVQHARYPRESFELSFSKGFARIRSPMLCPPVMLPAVCKHMKKTCAKCSRANIPFWVQHCGHIIQFPTFSLGFRPICSPMAEEDQQFICWRAGLCIHPWSGVAGYQHIKKLPR